MTRIFSLLAVFIIATSINAVAESTETNTDNALKNEGSWSEIKESIIGSVEPAIDENLFDVITPYRAHNAGTVPVEINQTNFDEKIKSMTLIIDENPAPVAAEISFGEAMHPVKFETRIRVDQYSNVRAIAESKAGDLYMQGRFVKASGGCSAPSTKDPELALRDMGKMRLKDFSKNDESQNRREVQLMIRHPNYSGLQRDQITQLFVNAHFINELEVYQGDKLLFAIEGGISISEDPIFRFEYDDDGSEEISVRAVDIEDNVFEQTFVGTEVAES